VAEVQAVEGASRVADATALAIDSGRAALLDLVTLAVIGLSALTALLGVDGNRQRQSHQAGQDRGEHPHSDLRGIVWRQDMAFYVGVINARSKDAIRSCARP